MTTRRTFLHQTSAAVGVGLIAKLSARQLWAATPASLLPEPDEALMRELALTAMDAARTAGATFADMRLAIARAVSVKGTVFRGQQPEPTVTWPALTLTAGYGVRAIVNGAWGFAHGVELTADAVAATARTAVAVARSNRPRRPRTLELALRPRVSNGVWATPMERDPLTVPLEEQGELIRTALARVAAHAGLASAQLSFEWRRPTTVFADTNGTLILQRLATARPGSWIIARAGTDVASEAFAEVPSLRQGSLGYEAVAPATLPTTMRQAVEQASMLAKAARTAQSVDVGRYDLVFGPRAVAELVRLLAGAVNLERALGYQANGDGTSFAAPPAEILGQYQVAVPLVSVHADRSQPGGGATTGWDEEGVEPEDYTFIKDGVIVDYHTDRQTAVELADWYRARGKPVRAHGCARLTGASRPRILVPNLTLAPGPESTTLDDLVAGTKRGFYVEHAYGIIDQQLLNGQSHASHTWVRRITNGTLGGYVRDFAFQYILPDFWKRVDGLGGAASADTIAVLTGDPFNRLQPFSESSVRTVPMRVRQVNVLNTGRTE